MRYFLVLMLLLSTKAAMASSVTLKEVLREVVRIDPRIASSGAAVEGRREDVQIAEEGYYPGVQSLLGESFNVVLYRIFTSRSWYSVG